MWLLNTTTLHLHFFASIPWFYATLSHRWEEEEVSFRQFNDAGMVQWGGKAETEHDEARKAEELQEFPLVAQLVQYHKKQLFSMKGMQKVRRFCEYAKKFHFDWAWADTCCIDKSSSAELQEAINSMFHYYAKSASCIVFLRDVCIDAEPKETLQQFRASEWFLRGWTLQELVGPDEHRFVDVNWRSVGTTKSLLKDISAASGIPEKVFDNEMFRYLTKLARLEDYNVAERMSWAALRKTTREEDMAYCLLGLFGVNMPLLYGEGQTKAFERLQLEILKFSTDETIFATKDTRDYLKEIRDAGGLLAPEPRCFRKSASRGFSLYPDHFISRTSFECTSHGLRIGTVLLENMTGTQWEGLVEKMRARYPREKIYFMPLRCFYTDTGNAILVPLQRTSISGGNKFVRFGGMMDAPADVKSLFANNPQQTINISLTIGQTITSLKETREKVHRLQ